MSPRNADNSPEDAMAAKETLSRVTLELDYARAAGHDLQTQLDAQRAENHRLAAELREKEQRLAELETEREIEKGLRRDAEEKLAKAPRVVQGGPVEPMPYPLEPDDRHERPWSREVEEFYE